MDIECVNLWLMKDFEELRQQIRTMTRSSKLYQVLRDELTTLGYWKRKPRGNPKKGYRVSRRQR